MYNLNMSGNRFFPKTKLKIGSRAKMRFVKTAKQMERHLKGVANHRRIEILFLIAHKEGISVNGISRELGCNLKTISEHIRRLVQAGLVEKNYAGHYIKHRLSPYGKIFIAFLTSFSNS